MAKSLPDKTRKSKEISKKGSFKSALLNQNRGQETVHRPSKTSEEMLSSAVVDVSKKYEMHLPHKAPLPPSIKYIPLSKKEEPKKEEKKEETRDVIKSPLEDMFEQQEKSKELEQVVTAAPRKEEELLANAANMYERKLAMEPTPVLYTRVKSLYEEIKEQGMMSAEQTEQMYHLRNAIQQKQHDADVGMYNPSSNVAKQLSLTEKILDDLIGHYRR